MQTHHSTVTLILTGKTYEHAIYSSLYIEALNCKTLGALSHKFASQKREASDKLVSKLLLAELL